MTANDLIAESITTDSTIHAACTDELYTDLLTECEGDVAHGDTHEFWGTAESGSEWRVHLTLTTSENGRS